MPWVGGIFTQTNGVNTGPTLWAQDQAQGFSIITSHHDTHDQDIATGLQNCVTVDGLNKLAASFIPAVDATYNIGSPTVRFQNEYLAGSLFLFNGNTNSIGLVADTLTGSRTITIPDISGAMVVTVATQTLTNKTLTSPTINGGTLAGATVTTPAITGAIFGPEGASAGQGGILRLEELAANGTNVTGFKAPDALAADVLYTMPSADGSSGQFLKTNGSKVLSWAATPSFSGGTITSTLAMSGATFNEAEASNIVAASTIDIGAILGNFVVVTNASGATVIGDLNSSYQAGARRKVLFSISGGSITLAQSSVLQLPSAINMPIGSGDMVEFTSFGGGWYVSGYLPYSVATKAIMQAGTDTFARVTPALVSQSDGVAKAHCAVVSNALVAGGFNVASITHSSTGVYAISFTTAFASAAYTADASAEGATPRNAKVTAKVGATCTVSTFADFACTTPADADFDFVAFGRQ